MKCCKCHTDNLVKDREDGRCKSCKHKFVFDPRRTTLKDPFNDILFEKSLRTISVNETLRFTPRQFCYFLNSMKAVDKTLSGLATLLLMIGIFGFFGCLASGNFFGALCVPLVCVLINIVTPKVQKALGMMPSRNLKFSYEDVVRFLERWAEENGTIKELLLSPSKELTKASVPKELKEYSFDRLLVCETDEIAQFFIANNFHFENNCAVLSLDGYPHNLFSTIMEMVLKNDQLKVYALHNANWRGLAMLETLRDDEKWFKNYPNISIIDIGLRPRQFFQQKMFVQQYNQTHAKTPKDTSSVTNKEKRWLDAANVVYLESLNPSNLIRVVTKGIALSRDPEKAGELVTVSDSSTDANIYMFSTDSFG